MINFAMYTDHFVCVVYRSVAMALVCFKEGRDKELKKRGSLLELPTSKAENEMRG
jgi:hypothetical protein